MKNSFLLPFIFVTSLFFLWGCAHSILDVLNKHFQEVLVISKARSALVQTVLYGGYFLMALPAGMIIKKFGYRNGVVFGLMLYGIGALMFIPAENIMSFNYFLVSLFVIGCGLTVLETAANPYITELGEPETASSRLNLAQSFNGLGWIVGPLLGGLLIFNKDGSSGSVALPYSIIGIIVLAVALLFSRLKLPVIRSEQVNGDEPEKSSLWKNKAFVFGVISLFFYVGAQTGINSFFINFVTESNPELSSRDAAVILSFGGMGLFMAGRFGGSWLMQKYRPELLLSIFAAGAALMMVLVLLNLSIVSSVALFICYAFESIMFPTIFALSIQGLGKQTKMGSSFLIMAIVGGALTPPLMGWIGERVMAHGFIVPLICFLVILAYGMRRYATQYKTA